jgi:hypothetical protein
VNYKQKRERRSGKDASPMFLWMPFTLQFDSCIVPAKLNFAQYQTTHICPFFKSMAACIQTQSDLNIISDKQESRSS